MCLENVVLMGNLDLTNLAIAGLKNVSVKSWNSWIRVCLF